MSAKIKSKIILRLPLTDREKAYAILFMGYEPKEVDYESAI